MLECEVLEPLLLEEQVDLEGHRFGHGHARGYGHDTAGQVEHELLSSRAVSVKGWDAAASAPLPANLDLRLRLGTIEFTLQIATDLAATLDRSRCRPPIFRVASLITCRAAERVPSFFGRRTGSDHAP